MLVLASASPRRREILLAAGIACTVRTSGVPEIHRAGESPQDYVQRLAREKAFAVTMEPGETILAADTVVVLDDLILEKPADEADAIRMLELLSGREHFVYTGICLRTEGESIVDVARTGVTFAKLEKGEIEEYARSGEPFDKAGGYAIQGLASKFVNCIQGCYFNVVGLPVSLVSRHLKRMGEGARAGSIASRGA